MLGAARSALTRGLSLPALGLLVEPVAELRAGASQDRAGDIFLPQIEIALRDTMIHKATGTGFDRLAKLYGMPRVFAFPERYWRRALLAAALGARGTFGVTHAVLEALFDFWAEPRTTYPVTLDPAQPARLVVDTERPGPPGFYCNHVGRLVRVTSPTLGSAIYWTRALSGSDLLLSTTTTTYWRGADWSALEAPEAATAKVLPFVYEEATPGDDTPATAAEPCLFRVYLDDEIWKIPPTYLQADGDIDRPTAAPGQPYGGQLIDYLDDDPTTPNEGDQVAGPFPPYLPGPDIGGSLSRVVDLLLAAGVRVEFKLKAFCADGDAFSIIGWTLGQGLPIDWDWRLPIPG